MSKDKETRIGKIRKVVLEESEKRLTPSESTRLAEMLEQEEGTLLLSMLSRPSAVSRILEESKAANHWLLGCRKDVNSQRGEDGVIGEILKHISTGDEKWCVEFGTLDGRSHSNTLELIQNFGWHSVQIEGEESFYEKLVETHKGNPRVECINAWVGLEPGIFLDDILGRTSVPKEIDVLSIDIDSNDYHVWKSLKNYSAKVVIIEFNPTIPPEVFYVQPPQMGVCQGSSLRAIWELGKEKGYTLVCNTRANAIFVRNDLAGPFDIDDQDPSFFFRTPELLSYLFQLYDGTLVVKGCQLLNWLKIPFGEQQLQVVPALCRGKFRARFPKIRELWLKYFHADRRSNRQPVKKDY